MNHPDHTVKSRVAAISVFASAGMAAAKFVVGVAIGSLAAVEPHAGLAAYVTFKSALVSLVRTVALENKDAGLTANVVLPGTMDTPANRKAMPGADFSDLADGSSRLSIA